MAKSNAEKSKQVQAEEWPIGRQQISARYLFLEVCRLYRINALADSFSLSGSMIRGLNPSEGTTFKYWRHDSVNKDLPDLCEIVCAECNRIKNGKYEYRFLFVPREDFYFTLRDSENPEFDYKVITPRELVVQAQKEAESDKQRASAQQSYQRRGRVSYDQKATRIIQRRLAKKAAGIV